MQKAHEDTAKLKAAASLSPHCTLQRGGAAGFGGQSVNGNRPDRWHVDSFFRYDLSGQHKRICDHIREQQVFVYKHAGLTIGFGTQIDAEYA